MAALRGRAAAAAVRSMVARPQLSIIIPALNEAAGIKVMLARVQPLRERGVEVILVDGGSCDDTPLVARPYVDQLLTCEPGRAVQMNAGAHVAKGELLWFLHADTLIDTESYECMMRALEAGPSCVWGRFDVRIQGNSSLFGLVATMMNLRSRLTGIATGDQGIFVTREAFDTVGGYPVQPLMEDIELSRALKTLGRPLCLDARLETSGRRWERHGVIRTIVLMWSLRLAYFLGARPERLALRYHRAGQ